MKLMNLVMENHGTKYKGSELQHCYYKLYSFLMKKLKNLKISLELY